MKQLLGIVVLTFGLSGHVTACRSEHVSAPSRHRALSASTGVADGLPVATLPCESPDEWPLSISSRSLPLTVHYRRNADRDAAGEVLAAMEDGYEFHIGQLGFRAPIDDAGECGDDGNLDAFIWPGFISCEVEAVAENPATSWDDRSTYMVIDPYGPYGGEDLHKTVVHEMAHTVQAAYDWFETPVTFEMFAIFFDQIFADAYEPLVFPDFQSRPEQSIDWNDDYETWFMYGASLFPLYLKDRHFEGKSDFVKTIWEGSENPPGVERDPRLNEPDFVDVLDDLLMRTSGFTYVDAVVEFARWRWYTGPNVDGRHFDHFSDGIAYLAEAPVATAAQVTTLPATVDLAPGPTMLGTVYIEIRSSRPTVRLKLGDSLGSDVRLVMQAMPGRTPGTDGELIAASGSFWDIPMVQGQRTLAITTVPGPGYGPYDPDTRSERTYDLSLRFSAP